MSHIFVSYAREDIDFVHTTLSKLKSEHRL